MEPAPSSSSRPRRTRNPVIRFDPGNAATHADPKIERAMGNVAEAAWDSLKEQVVNAAEISFDDVPPIDCGVPSGLSFHFESFLHNCSSPLADSWSQPHSEVLVNALKGSNPDLPFYEDALKRSDRNEWIKAMQTEIETLEKLGSWDEIPVTEANGRIIPTLWVLKVKRSPSGEFKKYKARHTARGDLEVKTGDEEEYSPVALWSSIRLIFMLGMSWDWYTCSLDTVAAFLTAKLPKPVCVALPRGFRSSSNVPTCLRLKKSLYGLSVASRLYWLNYTKALRALGFVQNVYDPCLFTRKDCIMALWVDDTIIACKTKAIADKLLVDISSFGFELKHDSSLTEFLGLTVERTGQSIVFKQPSLIVKVLEATSLYKASAVPTPSLQVEIGSDLDGEDFHEPWSYRAVVGMLLYLATNTRPDISCAVSTVARFAHNPKQSHAKAIKRIVRYLLGTASLGLTMKPIRSYTVNMWVDAAFAGLHNVEPHSSADSSRSRMGFVICIEDTPIIWQSKLLALTVLSTLEAEYMALSQGLRELLVVKRLLETLVEANGVSNTNTVVRARAFEDNQGAYLLATRHRITARTRYFLARYHWFWQHFDRKEFMIEPCASKLMRGDFLTKQPAIDDFVTNRKLVMGA